MLRAGEAPPNDAAADARGGWTRFRGPNGDGNSAAEVPVRWTEADYAWKADLPGSGHSQPVIWGEKVFVTCASEDGAERKVVSLDLSSGASRWVRRFPAEVHEKHRLNSYASSTPAVDGDRVYAAFSSPSAYRLHALDHDGKELWTRDLGRFQSQHGNGTSPILHEGLVILGNDQDGPSSVFAVEAATGEVRWKAERRTQEVAYGTPCILRREGGKPELILTSHAHGISSLDLATGALNWEARVFDKRTVSSPVLAASGLVLAACGSGGGGNFLVAVRPGGKGDITETHVAYKLVRSIPYVTTPVVVDDLVVLWGDRGVVSAIEGATGKVLFQERVEGTFAGSPVRAGDRIYCMSAEGEAVVIKVGRKFELLARNPLGEGSHSTPAIGGGRMLLRTFGRVLCVKAPQPASATGG